MSRPRAMLQKMARFLRDHRVNHPDDLDPIARGEYEQLVLLDQVQMAGRKALLRRNLIRGATKTRAAVQERVAARRVKFAQLLRDYPGLPWAAYARLLGVSPYAVACDRRALAMQPSGACPGCGRALDLPGDQP